MYVSGFLTPVPSANKDAYVEHARKAWPVFAEYGAVEMIEAWGDDVPTGKQTDFPRAVDLKEDETVVFSWIVWPDKETAHKCMQSMETDDRWQEMMDMPFDGRRMIFGDFVPVMHERT